MKIELELLEMEQQQRALLPLCFHAIHTKLVYGREEKDGMSLANARYGSLEMLSRTSPKPISMMPLFRSADPPEDA